MGRYAIVNQTNGLVINIIVYDGDDPYVPPNGCSIVNIDSTPHVDNTYQYVTETHEFISTEES